VRLVWTADRRTITSRQVSFRVKSPKRAKKSAKRSVKRR
jgi:hypothetical protein